MRKYIILLAFTFGWLSKCIAQNNNFESETIFIHTNESTFITGEIKKYSQIKHVYNQTTVYAKGISLNALNYLDGLRYSIQSWVYNNGSFIPILLDVKFEMIRLFSTSLYSFFSIIFGLIDKSVGEI